MLDSDAQLIQKERISSLRFPREPVTLSELDRSVIMKDLEKAAHLGNAEHGKCRILFEDDQGLKAVETTIWTFDPENIVLKYGMVIPVARVVRVEFP